MILTGEGARIVQLHPTRRCNLQCLHCYSTSGPRERTELPEAVVTELLDDAAAEGFNVASFSGGEPLLYRPLRPVLEHARARGFATTVVTNGTLVDEERVALLRDAADAVVVSIDGRPERHDRMRGRAGAFTALQHGVARLRDAGVRFALLFTLSEDSAGDLAWVARFAADHGATALQIHPLDETGRAATTLRGQRPGEATRAVSWLAAARLRELHPGLSIRVDLVDRADVAADGGAAAEVEVTEGTGLAALVSPLVVEPDGAVVPLQYGCARRFALGSLHDAPLRALARAWRADGHLAFRRTCASALRAIAAPRDLPFVDLYRELFDGWEARA